MRGIITLCMGDIHTLAGYGGKAKDEVRKSDERFNEYKQKVDNATSLTVLDAMITQVQNYKDQVAKRLESILREDLASCKAGGKKPNPQNIVHLRRYDVFPVKASDLPQGRGHLFRYDSREAVRSLGEKRRNPDKLGIRE